MILFVAVRPLIPVSYTVIPSAASISAPLVLVYPLDSDGLSPSMVKPLMVTLEAATWNISPLLIAAVAGTTMASVTRLPEHGLIALLGPRIESDLLTMISSA